MYTWCTFDGCDKAFDGYPMGATLSIGWGHLKPRSSIFWHTHRSRMNPYQKLLMYSLRFKIKVTLGHKMRYEIKVTFGENSLKLRQTNWKVVIFNVNVVVDELSSQITVYILFNNWYLESTASKHINTVLCTLVSSAQNGGLLVKLAPEVFNFTMDTHGSPESPWRELCDACSFRAKSAKNDLKPTHFLKHNLYFETEGVEHNKSIANFISPSILK